MIALNRCRFLSRCGVRQGVLQISLAGPEDRLPPRGGTVSEGTPTPAPSDPPKSLFSQRYKRPVNQTSARVHRARASPRWCRGAEESQCAEGVDIGQNVM